MAAFGILIFAILIAPTSSVIPIRDPIAERRLYLPFLGLALVAIEVIRRLKVATSALVVSLGGILLICMVGTYQRAQVWSSPLAFWADAAAKSPAKPRPHFQLAYAQYENGRCDLANEEYARTAKMQPLTYELALDWGIALDCSNRTQEAMEKMDQAAALERSAHPLAEKARILAKLARKQEALAALDAAEKINPQFEYIYVYRGAVYESGGDWTNAAVQFQKALALNPNNTLARDGLGRANYGIGARRR
jgi:tetratricopeptide (TPR) repeat protein